MTENEIKESVLFKGVEAQYRVAKAQALMLAGTVVKLQAELDMMTDQRDWWSRVARSSVRQRVLARVTLRVLGRGMSTRVRDADELRRMIDSLVQTNP